MCFCRRLRGVGTGASTIGTMTRHELAINFFGLSLSLPFPVSHLPSAPESSFREELDMDDRDCIQPKWSFPEFCWDGNVAGIFECNFLSSFLLSLSQSFFFLLFPSDSINTPF